MKRRHFLILIAAVGIGYFSFKWLKKINLNPNYEVGQAIDSLNGVKVYYNGGVDHVKERRVVEGYNLGLEFQCVEFVKRYYWHHFNHKMPDSYGHAISFFNPVITDGELNTQRDLLQFTNPSQSCPKVNDIIVFSAHIFNPYGHVAIVSGQTENEIEIIQQNPGPFKPTRLKYTLSRNDQGFWQVDEDRVLGWLRMKP